MARPLGCLPPYWALASCRIIAPTREVYEWPNMRLGESRPWAPAIRATNLHRRHSLQLAVRSSLQPSACARAAVILQLAACSLPQPSASLQPAAHEWTRWKGAPTQLQPTAAILGKTCHSVTNMQPTKLIHLHEQRDSMLPACSMRAPMCLGLVLANLDVFHYD